MNEQQKCHNEVAYEIIEIDFENTEVYESGTRILSALLYPEKNNENRNHMETAICAKAIRWIAKNEPEWANHYQPLKPKYLLCSEKEIDKATRKIEKELQKRFEAVRMAIGPISKALNIDANIPKKFEKGSLEQMAQAIANDPRVTESEPQNVKSRIWRPSRRVIHLSIAIQQVKNKLFGEIEKFDPALFFYHRDFVGSVVTTAMNAESFLISECDLNLKDADLIKFRLI